MIRLLTAPLSPSRIPAMSRDSYRRELTTSWTFPAAVSLTEGAVAGYLAVQVFHATAAQVAIITAAGMFTNLTSVLWAYAVRGRRKVPSIAALMGGTLACVAGIGLLPVSPAGAWMFTALVVLAQALRIGMITLRSIVWRHNYPRLQRGRITGRLAIVVNAMLLTAPTVGSVLLEADVRLFRVLHLAAAALGLVGVLSFAGIRLRGERALLDFERRPEAEPTRHGDAAGIYEFDEKRRTPRMGMWAVLRRDPHYRRYMLWQFVAGVSNMMVEPVLVLMAAAETRALGGEGGFIIGLGLTHGLPTLVSILTLPLWAAKLDRMHVVRFRVGQAWLWTASQLIVWVGAIGAVGSGSPWVTLAILGVGRLVLGIARGAGTLAWNLGHNDFASREMVSVYMGIHITLTGVRGAFAPFLGVALFTGAGAWAGIGGHVFAISAVLSAISAVGFWMLDRRLRRLGAGGPRLD